VPGKKVIEVVPEAEFREWLAAAGIVEDALGRLSFAGAEAHEGFWLPSFVPGDLPGFIGTALHAVAPEGAIHLLRQGGGGWFESHPSGSNQMIETVLRTYGVPPGAAGALRLAPHEWKARLAIILAFYVHGWSVSEDLYLVGDERDAVLMFSHHGRLEGRFRTVERMEAFAAAMLAGGYDMPGEDIQWPAWLKGARRSGRAR
jgi:hypothetical protein